jgi:acyl-CoA reductase-like NAD-dependent aldehyde dehydrogenase
MECHDIDLGQVQSSINQLRAAVIDRRSDNVRYRQNELYRLYVTLRARFDELSGAVRQDTSCSIEEAEQECYLALDAVRQFYEGLDFGKSLKDEYLVTGGADFPNKRVGYGLLVLLPTTHSRLYSILTAVAAAKAAGNCILLEVSTAI